MLLLATLAATAALAAPVGAVETAFRAHGLALHPVARLELVQRGRRATVGLDSFGGAAPRVLALPRTGRDLEVVVFARRADAARVAPLFRRDAVAAALARGSVLVVYDRRIAPSLLARARAALHELPR